MKSHPLTPHAAHVLAARLRERGIHAAGRDVFRWPGRTIQAARLWLDALPPHAGLESWKCYMGNDLPPPSQHSWPGASAAGRRELDGTGDVHRAGNR
jgi:hypothetical protein